MERSEFEVYINEEQARKFAKVIIADIADYVENHREELEQLLEEEAKSEVSTDETLENR